MKICSVQGITLIVAVSAVPLSIQARQQPASVSRHNVLAPYIDPKQQTTVGFGMRSHWMQPWRAYMDTLPVARLRDSVGINLNVSPEEADATCRHLAKNGFRQVRIEYGWGNVPWEDPAKLTNQGAFDQVVAACKKYGLRPLFLLNGHHGVPCPIKMYDIRLTQPAHKGDRTVHVDPATLSQAVMGRSGFSRLTDYWGAETLFTAIAPDGTVTLSKPLPKDLPAGNAPAATLKYLPFYPAKLKSTGLVPPQFTETMRGWVEYVRDITTNARRVLGTEGKPDAGFDLEVWNELTFGSKFLSINNYYDKPVADGDPPYDEILRQTVDYVRDAKNALPHVGVGNGFNNQWPWGAGSTVPPGLAALDKHPYAGVRIYPRDQGQPNGIRPVNALGELDGTSVGTDRPFLSRKPGFSATLYDPMQDKTIPMKVLAPTKTGFTMDAPLTDSPRLLLLDTIAGLK